MKGSNLVSYSNQINAPSSIFLFCMSFSKIQGSALLDGFLFEREWF